MSNTGGNTGGDIGDLRAEMELITEWVYCVTSFIERSCNVTQFAKNERGRRKHRDVRTVLLHRGALLDAVTR